ncbi:MAG: PAS domain-containing protein [Planctomycetota bacterium]|jgi:PAS domain S-box-containing protein
MSFRRSIKRQVDIGDREQVEQILRHLGLVTELAEEGIAIIDLSSVLHFVNTAWARMHGYDTSGELVDRTISTFHTKEQMNAEVAAFLEEAKKKEQHTGTLDHLRKDGTIFPAEIRSTALKDERDNAIGFIVMATDLTAGRQTDDALKKHCEQLEKSLEQQRVELTKGKKQIEHEKSERKKAESHLKQLKDQVEQQKTRQKAEQPQTGEQLKHDIAESKQATEDLKKVRDQFEQCIAELTCDLTTANEQLQRQIAERKQTQASLSQGGSDEDLPDEEIELLNPDRLKTLSDLAKKLR